MAVPSFLFVKQRRNHAKPHKVLFPLVPLLRLFQHLLSLLEFGVHQLLLQVFVFEDLVDVLPRETQQASVEGSHS